MLIIGHSFIDYLPFYEIISFEDIENTPSNSTVFFDFDPLIAKKCKTNNISYAMRVKDIKELLFCNALECDFALVECDFAKEAQKIANEYLFDTKILQIINSDNELENVAKNGIDGVIFENALKRR